MRDAIRRTLAIPNALDNLDRSIEEVVNIINGGKQTPEVQKFEAFIKETVNYKVLWKEISRNIKIFSNPIHFEGGFTVLALAKLDWTEEDFKINGMGAFCSSIRGIRNALFHGRDQKTTCVITPTKHNFELLQPWTLLIATAAAEAMIYKGI